MSTNRLNCVVAALSTALILGFALNPAAAVAQAQDNSKQQSVAPTISTGPDAPTGAPGLPKPPDAPVAPTGLRNIPYDYKIGEGDSLFISVWKEPEATMGVVVRPDGMISMPLTKELRLAGLTPVEAGNLITEKLVKSIQEPDVTVIVTGMGSKKIYVTGGGVKREGPIPYTYAMTVMQAISEAGGLTDFAKKKKIYVLRIENGKQIKFPFDYDAVLNGVHMEMNIVMVPGDNLVAPTR
jgi:polysaccharide export outer membrane protein